MITGNITIFEGIIVLIPLPVLNVLTKVEDNGLVFTDRLYASFKGC